MGISKTANDIFARVNIKGVIIMGGSIIGGQKIGYFNSVALRAKFLEIAGGDNIIQPAEINAYIPKGSSPEEINAEMILKYFILSPSNNAMNITLTKEETNRMESVLEVAVDSDVQYIPTDFKLTGKYNSKGFPLVVIDNQFYQNFPADDIRRKPVFDVSYDGGQTIYTSLDVTKVNPADHQDITLNDEQGLYVLKVSNPSIINISRNGNNFDFDIVNGSKDNLFLEGSTVEVESSTDMIIWTPRPNTVTESGGRFHASLQSPEPKMFFRAKVTVPANVLDNVTLSAKLLKY